MRFVRRLVGEHRLADDVADGEDVRHVGAHLDVDRNEAAVADRHAGVLGADALAVRDAADRLQHQVVELRLGRRALAFEADEMPSAVASAPTVFVFSMMWSKRGAFIFCQTLTRSRSAPCIRPSSISTTSSLAPRSSRRCPSPGR
jgi:hypothetical protein